jgi:hypothetical protein
MYSNPSEEFASGVISFYSSHTIRVLLRRIFLDGENIVKIVASALLE